MRREPHAPWLVVTGLDGAGKTTLVRRVAERFGAFLFRLPYHDFVRPALELSGGGTPFGDVHTDRLVFAADARLTNSLIRGWEKEHKALVSQRGWMDNFVFGAVQGMKWKETERLLAPRDLTRAAGVVCLVADPDVAWARIRPADKFETPDFLVHQRAETLRLMAAVDRDPALEAFRGIPSRVVDTTRLTTDEVWADVEPLARKTLTIDS